MVVNQPLVWGNWELNLGFAHETYEMSVLPRSYVPSFFLNILGGLHIQFFEVYFYVCACMHMDIKGLHLLSFHHAGTGNGTQTPRRGGKHLFPLSHLTSPSF